MRDILINIKEQFEDNISSVKTLLEFDQFTLQYSINSMKNLNQKLREDHGIENPKLTVDSALKILENIKQNKSINKQYKTIYNQSLVLLVSYYTSTINEIFINCIYDFIKAKNELNILKEEIKISVGQIKKSDFDLSSQIAELIINKKNYSFQDMKSTLEALKDCFNFECTKNNDVNNIIYGQACRHSIVHNGAKADKKFLNQIKNAFPRDVAQNPKEENIELSPLEVELIAKSMLSFIDKIISSINRNYYNRFYN